MKPDVELRVAFRLRREYMPVSVSGERRTVYVVRLSRAPDTVVTKRVFFDSSLPFSNELAKRAPRR